MKVALALLVAGSLAYVEAQTTATLRGEVHDIQGVPVSGARVWLRNALAGFEMAQETTEAGTFLFSNLPLQSYSLKIERPGFRVYVETVNLRSNVPVATVVTLQLADQITQIEVAAGTGDLVDTQSTGTRTELNLAAIERMPVAPGTRGLESLLLSLPGFAADANGAIHPRGAHNQMTYVIDGMPVSDQLTGAFGNSVDTSVVQTIELFTGNVPAEFGNKVSGVAVITTRTGLGSARRFSGNTQLIGGGFDTLGSITQLTGGTDRWGYFASVNALRTNRFLDQVSTDNLHNGGNSERAFARADYMASAKDQVRLSLMSGRSSFQLANLRSQQMNGQDQRQRMDDVSASFGWLRTLDSATTVDTNVSFRMARARLFPSPGDIPVTAHQDRRLTTYTVGSRWNHLAGRHNWRAGADVQRFPVREEFSYAITRPEPTPLFRFAARATGALYSGFVQDSIRVRNLQLSLGARYDNYRFLSQGSQLQPRIGFAYHVSRTNTVFRGSYNRTYQTPPNENLLLSSTGRSVVPIRPERQNVFEVGLQQGLGRFLSVNSAFYHKNSRDLQDNDNFLNTGIIFPISLARSRTNGLEARVTLVPIAGFSGSFSLTHLHTVVTPPFTGGLFLGASSVGTLSQGAFIIDHDQPLGMHGVLHYNLSRNIWLSTSVRYDSGLVANPSDPDEVAADPDYRDLLPYVNLLSDPARVRPRTITDIALGYGYTRGDKRIWDVTLQLANVANVTALYNFQSIFVGTRLVQPRSASIKLRFWF